MNRDEAWKSFCDEHSEMWKEILPKPVVKALETIPLLRRASGHQGARNALENFTRVFVRKAFDFAWNANEIEWLSRKDGVWIEKENAAKRGIAGERKGEAGEHISELRPGSPADAVGRIAVEKQ